MSDNVQITPGTGDTVLADQLTDGTLGLGKAQFVKVMDGTLDSSNKLIVSAAGAAKVDGSGVTQPISGTVTTTPPSNASTNVTQIGGAALAEGQTTMANSVPVVIASNQTSVPVTLTSTTVTGNVTVVQPTGTNLHVVVDSAPSTAVTGTVAVSNFPATQPISAASLPLPSGAATSSNQTTAQTTLSTIASNTTNAGTPVVSGTVTANAGTGTFAVSAASLPLPTGAATSANQATEISSLSTIATNTSSISTTQDKIGSGTITALNGTVVATTNGCSSCNVNVTGTWTATITIQGTVDGTNWFSIDGDVDITDVISSTITTNGLVNIVCGGYLQVRLIATAFTSGTVNISWDASSGNNIIEVFNTNPASLMATARIQDGSGNSLNSTANALNVAVQNFPATTAVTQSTSPWVDNVTQLGGVAVAAQTKQVQATNFFPTQDVINTGRTPVIFSIDRIAGVAAEALATFTINKGGAVSSATSYTVTAGKTLRIQSFSISVADSTTTAVNGRVRIRSAASVLATSPIFALLDASNATGTALAGAGDDIQLSIPDGLEIAGGQQVGISQILSSVSSTLTVGIIGFEY